ncbi:MAG: YafY family transcriptional regulator [Saccharospirillaceae bacterium]|nr:YafY family transcriptional regulator [Pseudomonadales bacterium]NRB77800.1 YafY family transcriptional regulator [Saccharospirillaceae bacterium]
MKNQVENKVQPNTTNRMSRLDEVIGILRECEETTVKQLAGELNVSVRTLMRDLKLLRDKGYPIESDAGRGGGIRLNAHYGIGRLMLSYEEVLDLLLAINVIEQLDSPILLTHLKSLQNKLTSSFPQSYRKKIRGLRKRILVGAVASNTVSLTYPKGFKSKLSETIQKGFFDQKLIELKYADNKGKNTIRIVEIQYLYVNWPVWYLLVWDHLRDDVRCLRLDRVQTVKILNDTFKLKKADPFLKGFEQFCQAI